MKLAPTRVGLFLWLRMWRFGRQDRRGQAATLDTTRTHSIQWLEGYVRASQHLVNDSYLVSATKAAASAAQLESQIENLRRELATEDSARIGLKGRSMARSQVRSEGVQRRVNENLAQLSVNAKTAELEHARATAALDSWSSFYEQAASIYLRSRMRKNRGQSSQAGIPTLSPVELADVSKELKLGN